jgi:hypothetical protein
LVIAYAPVGGDFSAGHYSSSVPLIGDVGGGDLSARCVAPLPG